MLECIVMLYSTRGTDCRDDPEACAEFIQSGVAGYVSTEGKGKGKGKNGKYPARPPTVLLKTGARSFKS